MFVIKLLFTVHINWGGYKTGDYNDCIRFVKDFFSPLCLSWPLSSCWSYCWLCLKPSAVPQQWTSPSSRPCSLCLFTSCAYFLPQCTSWCAHLLRAPVTSAASPGVLCLLPLPSPQQCFVFWSL